MSSALIFIAVLGGLVIVHEFGHFIVAKMVGVRVEKFSIGFGPVIFGRRIGETEFCVSILPLGGFVKLAGESAEEAKGMPWEFNSKNLLQKFLIVFAGPFMNAFLAFVLFSLIFMIGQPTPTAKIGKLMENAPAQTAGLREGDKITAIGAQKISLWEDVLKEVRKGESKMTFTVEREGKSLDILVAPKIRETRTIFGKNEKIAFVGISPSNEMVYLRYSFFKAVALGLERVWAITSMIFYSLGLMISGTVPLKDSMTGPIGIFFMTKQAAEMGIGYLLYFTGSLSVSLFVLNLLPIPVLDGGHVLFILIEKLKGSPLKESLKEKMTQGGLIVLLTLMVFVIFQDVNRFSIVKNVVDRFTGR